MRAYLSGLLSVALALGAVGRVVAKETIFWADFIRLSGDARFRYQFTDESDRESRERWRFRGRIGLDAQVNDQLKANLRLVTNAGDPISDNITMGGGFDDPGARLDRVFFTWIPVADLALRFGKMSQPWIAVDDLVFSSEANPEGIAVNYRIGHGALIMMLHGGAFMLEERRADDEAMLYSGQAAWRLNLGAKNYVMAGASLYAFEKVKGFGEIGKFDGNSTLAVGDGDDAGRVYAGGFTMIEGFVKAERNIGVPLTLGMQYAVNIDAFSSEDTAWLAMATVKLPAGFGAGYQYRYIEKDAVFGGLAEYTDFNNGTDVRGHISYVTYQISQNFSVKVLYAMGHKASSGGERVDTFKIDLACRF